MPLIKGFRSTTLTKAFILNSMVPAIFAFIVIVLKHYFEKYFFPVTVKSWSSVISLVFLTFFAYLQSYFIMYVIFGFGDDLLDK